VLQGGLYGSALDYPSSVQALNKRKARKKQECFSRWPGHTSPLAAQAALQKYPGSVEARGNLVNHTHRHVLLKAMAPNMNHAKHDTKRRKPVVKTNNSD
jgi:hypothetical protein